MFTPPSRGRRRKAVIASAVVAVAAIAAVWVVSTDSRSAEAHGSTQVPASRVYSCRFEQPDNPMCASARSADPQAIYDWMEVNIGDADGRHQQLIPDGELCSAGRDKYAAFDRPGEWPVTRLTPNSSGQYDVVYTNTAPHATAYYRLMLTREGFDARTDTLRWADLEQVYDSGPLAAAQQNRFTVSLPDRSEPAILYVIWQRSDSPEAFYSCSDVTIGGAGGGGAAPPPTTAPATTAPPTTGPPATGPTTTPSTPTTAPSTSAPPTTASPEPTQPPTTPNVPPDSVNPYSATAGVLVSGTTTADWDTGYCTEIRVENTTAAPVTWEVRYRPDGTVATVWNAQGDERDGAGRIAFAGEAWNERVAAGASTTFGMCVDSDRGAD
jgi:predicted carbohydrate-binding protein with CBM5 and CBM33 domain